MSHKKKSHRKTKYNIAIIIVVCSIFIISYLLINSLFQEQNADILPNELCEKTLTRDILDESLELGTQFLLNNQKPNGNFNYEYDFVNEAMNEDDNEVRQAGALWGLSLIYNDNPDGTLLPAIKNGFEFFKNCSKESSDGRKWIVYPNTQAGKTGTVALVSLSIIDFLRSAEEIDGEFREELESDLDKYITFLVSLRFEDGLFHQAYTHDDGTGYGPSSPYYDGESLLALTKAAKYMGKDELKQIILSSAEATNEAHIIAALQNDPDSAITKGFFQWGCMAYFELTTTGWQGTEGYLAIVINLADWMIDVHRTLERTRNTAYAYEGIIHACELAKRNGDEYHVKKFACTINEGLYKLTTWQVAGPIQNEYLQNHPTSDKLAVGGIMNHKEEPPLRIDVTQHQMHAVILARRYVYLS